MAGGIRTALKMYEEDEGAQAALDKAEKWHLVLEEIMEVACPENNNPQRVGPPQAYCCLVLLAAVKDYIVKNPIVVQSN